MDHNEHKDGPVRERAYQLWEEEGRPEGRHEDHWRQASDEVSQQLAGDGAAGDDSISVDVDAGLAADTVANPLAVPAAETLPPGSQPTGIDGAAGDWVGSEQQAGSGRTSSGK